MKRKRPYTTGEKIILFLLKCGVLFGILMMIGGVGNIDLADETGMILTKAEETRYYLTSIMGFPVVGICICMLSKIDDMCLTSVMGILPCDGFFYYCRPGIPDAVPEKIFSKSAAFCS